MSPTQRLLARLRRRAMVRELAIGVPLMLASLWNLAAAAELHLRGARVSGSYEYREHMRGRTAILRYRVGGASYERRPSFAAVHGPEGMRNVSIVYSPRDPSRADLDTKDAVVFWLLVTGLVTTLTYVAVSIERTRGSTAADDDLVAPAPDAQHPYR